MYRRVPAPYRGIARLLQCTKTLRRFQNPAPPIRDGFLDRLPRRLLLQELSSPQLHRQQPRRRGALSESGPVAAVYATSANRPFALDAIDLA